MRVRVRWRPTSDAGKIMPFSELTFTLHRLGVDSGVSSNHAHPDPAPSKPPKPQCDSW